MKLIALFMLITACQSDRLLKCEHTLENTRVELELCRASQMEELVHPCEVER